ncbi:EboA domain-containing protein [Algoriphagus vanfongensis]|uniref:EboA domain-containing protein n=1 Tax=Algoriphagus vanfongensis TaxID=426371 RepID=UPI00047C484A|nr:EboA domain-containing protein [Algoriphagus vanfongensis]
MASTQDIRAFLSGILSKNAAEKSMLWLLQKSEKIQSTGSQTAFFLAFSQASRFFDKGMLVLDETEKKEAHQLVEGYEPEFWNVLQTARTYLLLSFPQEKEAWFAAVNQLFETADMHEHQALFAALPLMPFQEDLIDRAIDGCRTNVALIFDAIALNNPYPAKYFPEANWNQMVLKAVFMQRPLYRIQSQDARSNPALAEIARDFAHERWAAGRNVMPELWRLVSPFLNEKYLQDLQKVMSSKDELELAGGALALFNGPSGTGKTVLGKFPTLVSQIESGTITWETVGKEYQKTRV